MYLIRVFNTDINEYIYLTECSWHTALKQAKKAKEAFNQTVEIYERKEVI
jgi:hypothetical protein